MIKDLIHVDQGWYEEFNIPKKNGKFRQIVAPNPSLKAYQRSLLPRLESLYQKLTSGSEIAYTAHGFISNRNCVTAASQHIGFDYTRSIDISNFFNSVYRHHLAEYDQEIAEDDNLWHIEGYAAQGFATSPILANIASIPILMEIKEYLIKNYQKHAFTIYADDIHFSINQRKDIWIHLKRIENKIVKIINSYGFEVHPHKTHTLQAKYGYRRILGINVGQDHLRATRKTMKRIRAAKHQGNYHSLGGLVTWSLNLLPRALR